MAPTRRWIAEPARTRSGIRGEYGMKKIIFAASAPLLFAVAACDGPAEETGEEIDDITEAQAEVMDAEAGVAEAQADLADEKAEAAATEVGEAEAEAEADRLEQTAEQLEEAADEI